MAEELIRPYLEDMEEARASAAQVRAQVDPYLSTDRAQAILRDALATADGQRLYENARQVLYPSQLTDSLRQTATAVEALASDPAIRDYPEIHTEVHEAAARLKDVATMTTKPFVPADRGNSSYTASAYTPVNSIPTYKAPNPLPNSPNGAGSNSSGTSFGSSTKNKTPVPDTEPPEIGGYGYKTNSPTKAENYQTNSKVLDYIRTSDQRLNAGNVTDADQMVISELSYVTKSVPDSSKPFDSRVDGKMTVGEYCERLLAQKKQAMANDPNYQADAAEYQFLQEMARSKRYKDLPIDCISPYHDGQTDTNIISVNIGSNQSIIGIQGTNGTVQDWLNDKEMANPDPTKEEMVITNQFDSIVREYGYDGVYVTGHSQGGRDATTAGAFCSDEVRDRIIQITNLDGPGYSKEFWEKHGDELGLVEDKVRNIYPSGSYVGQILHPVGDGEYTESLGDQFNFYLHSQFNWEIDPETGSLVPADESSMKYITGKLINFGVDYVVDHLSPEQANQAGSIILRLMYDEKDPTKLEFGNIGQHLDEISLGDAVILAESAVTVIASAVGDIAEKVEKIAGAIENVCKIITLVAGASLSPHVAAVVATIAQVCHYIKLVAKVVKYVSKAVVWILQKIAEIREKRLAAERASYISSSPEMKFISEALLSAAGHLEAANKYIMQADSDCDRIRRGFEESSEDENGIISWFRKIFSTINAVLSWCGAGVIDLLWLKNQPILTKGVRACNTVSAEGLKLLSSVSYAGSDSVFYVIPGALSNAAESGVEAAKNAQQKATESMETIEKLGSAWKGDDYNSLKTSASDNIQKLTESIQQMEKNIGVLSTVAQIYSQFQERSVQEFQAAKN